MVAATRRTRRTETRERGHTVNEHLTSHPEEAIEVARATGVRRRRWATTAVLGSVVALALAGCSSSTSGTGAAALVGSTPSQASADSGSVTFSYTGHEQTWTVPTGVTSVSFEVGGGRGGSTESNVMSFAQPGSGAVVIGTVPVTPGQVMTIAVGGDGGGGAGGWGDLGMSGGPANTAKPSDRSGGSGGGATMVALANADGSDWHQVVVAGGGGGQGGGSSDPADAGAGGNAGCSALHFFDGSMECGTPSITGSNGNHGSPGPLGGAGGVAGGSTTSTGGRGLGAKDLGGNGGSGGGGVNGGTAGGGAKSISAGGGGGAGTSYVDTSVASWQISAMDYNVQFPWHLSDSGVILTW